MSLHGRWHLPVRLRRDLRHDDEHPLGGLLNQDPTERNWGPPLHPGSYEWIVSRTEHETCVFPVPGGLFAVGNSLYTWDTTGKRAAGPTA